MIVLSPILGSDTASIGVARSYGVAGRGLIKKNKQKI